MKLERKALLDALETVRPGLLNKAQIEAFSHIWFSGAKVMAYNDTNLGMEAPFECELKGGVRGPLLLGMLNASRAKEVEITEQGSDEILLKAGGTKLTLPLLPAEDAVWKFPKTETKPFTLTKELLKAVDAVLVSTSDPEPSTPEKLGVTFEPSTEEGWMNLYTTDSVTIAASSCPLPKGYKCSRVTTPTAFWVETLKQCKEGGKVWLLEDSIIAESEKGVRIFAKLVDVPNPVDFEGNIKTALPKAWAKKALPVPPRLPLAFQRACILLEGHEQGSVLVSAAQERVRLEAKSSFGELKESIKLEDGKTVSEDVEIALDPNFVSRGLKQADKFLLTEDCMALFHGTHSLYLVSAVVRN